MALLTESARPRVVREHPHAPWLAVGSVCVGAFMGQLNAGIVTLIFPAIQREFHTPLAAAQWSSLGYLLALVGLLPGAGRLADALGRKLIYLYGFVIFTLLSAACGLAPSLGWLVAFRVAQAAGAAMLQANSIALVTAAVPAHRMRTALSVQAAAQALGLAFGPPLGGLLVASAGWQWVFWINIPIGCAAIVIGHLLLPRTKELTAAKRLDWPGLVLLPAVTTALLLAISGASGLGLPGWAIVALLLVSVLAAAGFWIRENRTDHPLIPTTLLRTPAVASGLVGAMCGYLVLFGPFTLMPQLLTESAARTGLILTALPAGFVLAALTGGFRFAERFGNRARSVTGAAISAIAAGALIAAPYGGGSTIAALALLGIGLGIFLPANNATIMAAVPARRSGTAGGLVNTTRGVGTALGIALITLTLHFAAQLALGILALIALIAGISAMAPRTTARTGHAR